MSASCVEQVVCSSHKGRSLGYDCSQNVDVEVAESTMMMKLKWLSFVSSVAAMFSYAGFADGNDRKDPLGTAFDEAGKSWSEFLSKDSFADLKKTGAASKVEEEKKKGEARDEVDKASERLESFQGLNQIRHVGKIGKQKEAQERLHSVLDLLAKQRGFQLPPINTSSFSMPETIEECRVDFTTVTDTLDEFSGKVQPFAANQLEAPLREEVKNMPKALKEIVNSWFMSMGRIVRTNKDFEKDRDSISNPALSLSEVEAQRDRILPEIDSAAEEELGKLQKGIGEDFEDFENPLNESLLVSKVSAKVAHSAKLFQKQMERLVATSARDLKRKCDDNVKKANDGLMKWKRVEQSMSMTIGGMPLLTQQTQAADSYFSSELNNKCTDVSGQASGVFSQAGTQAGKIGGSRDFPSFLNGVMDFMTAAASGVNQLMGIVNQSELVQTCKSAVDASKKWCAHIAQAGLSCTGDGSSQAPAASGLPNQQQSASTAAPNGVAGNPLLLHSLFQGLGGRR